MVCNLCAVEGHKSTNFPNKDRCRRCHQTGHFSRNCLVPWSAPDAQVNYPDEASFSALPGAAATLALPGSSTAGVDDEAQSSSLLGAVVGSAAIVSGAGAGAAESRPLFSGEPDLAEGVAEMEEGQFEDPSGSAGVLDSQGYLADAHVVAEGHVTSDPDDCRW